MAITAPGDAVALIRQKIATANDRVTDVGRVSGTLIRSLNLRPGEFVIAAPFAAGERHFGRSK